MPLPNPRGGKLLKPLKRPLGFSFWPVTRTTRRYGIQSHVFATNPWVIIRSAIARYCPPINRAAASAMVSQAEDFYRASLATANPSTKPLLIYYSFLNLAKALVLHRSVRPSYAKAEHGLSEKLDPGHRELLDAYLEAHHTTATRENVYSDFLEAIAGAGLSAKTRYDVPKLLAQVLQGHRIWCECASAKERFIQIESIEFWHKKLCHHLWLRFYLFADDLSRLNCSHAKCLQESGLALMLSEVATDRRVGGRNLLCFEQLIPDSYTGRPTDEVLNLVKSIRPHVWANVLSMPPYRRYYLYLCPPADRPQLVPQLASIYLLFYYLGSITRYRPHHFDSIMTNAYAPQIEEFIQNTPNQFYFLIAGEFLEQEVTKAAIV